MIAPEFEHATRAIGLSITHKIEGSSESPNTNIGRRRRGRHSLSRRSPIEAIEKCSDVKRLGAVPPPYPLGWPPNVVFTQPPVEQIMRSAAAAHDSVQLSLGTELIGLEQDASGVRLRLRGDEGGVEG